MYDAMLAESVTIIGHNGDEIEAYSARTLQAGPVGGVVVIHHLPGYDRQTAEFARAFAAGGLNAVMPNLYHREAPGAAPDDAMAAARASGAIPVPDERIVGEVAGAAAYLRGLSNSNGKVGVIGHCSGGRQSFLAAVSLPLDAAVDCYGGFVVETPPEGHPLHGSPAWSSGPGTCPAPCSACSAPRTSTPRPSTSPNSKPRSRRTARPMSSTPTTAPGTPSCRSIGPATGPRPPWTPGSTFGRSSAVTCYRPWLGRSRNVHLPDGEGLDQRQRQGTIRLVPADRR